MAHVRLPLELLETWAAARVPGRAWRTLMALAAHANREGLAWPGPARIGRLAKIDPADARDALGDLAEAGLIKRAGTVPTPNGPANRWQIIGLGRDVVTSSTQGQNAPSTQGESAPRAETPTQGDTQGGTQGDTQGEVAPRTYGKAIENNINSIERASALEWVDVLSALRACGFKIDDPVGKPEAHKLVESLKSADVDPKIARHALTTITKRPAPTEDRAAFFTRQRHAAKAVMDDVIADAVRASNERFYAACPSNLVRSKIWNLKLSAYDREHTAAAEALVEAVKIGRVSQEAALAAIAVAQCRFNGARLMALQKPLLEASVQPHPTQ